MGIKWVNCSFRYTEIRFFFFFYHTAAHLKSNYIRCYTRGFSSCVPLHFSLCVCICVQFCACVCIHHIFLLWFDQFRQKMVGTMNISVPAENHGATGCHRLSATVVCVCVCVCVWKGTLFWWIIKILVNQLIIGCTVSEQASNHDIIIHTHIHTLPLIPISHTHTHTHMRTHMVTSTFNWMIISFPLPGFNNQVTVQINTHTFLWIDLMIWLAPRGHYRFFIIFKLVWICVD